MSQVCVIGTGYVGLAAGACLASLGHNVICADRDQSKVDLLSRGEIPIVEDGLEALVRSGLSSSRLTFTTSSTAAVEASEFVFLCLPTPQDEEGRADMSFIYSVIDEIRETLRPNSIVVNKSTVPVGAAREISSRIGRSDISVVSNPEFLRQGTAVKDFLHPTRIVVGANDDGPATRLSHLYRDIDAPILTMNTESAESVKYAANSFLATKLTFINAIADICEVVGADVFDVVQGVGTDPRIGMDFLNPGPGWGGSCFPKDTRMLVHIAANAGYDFSLLRGVIETNDYHYLRIANKVVKACEGNVSGKTVAAWGLTFKANTDDLRDSPAIEVLTRLHREGARVVAHDPTANGSYRNFPWIAIAETPLLACKEADVLVILTEWPVYKSIDPSEVSQSMRVASVVDSRNILTRHLWESAGFQYTGVGR